jgi:hypothetical protein
MTRQISSKSASTLARGQAFSGALSSMAPGRVLWPLVAGESAVLAAALFSYGWFVRGLGGNSDDLYFSHVATAHGLAATIADMLTHWRPRLLFATVLNTMYVVFRGHWPAIHLVSLVTLLLGAALLMRVVWKWTSDAAATLTAGAIFALHPAPNDTVLWANAWAHLAVAVFAIGVLLAMTRFAESGRKRHAVAAAFLFSCALGCIEPAYVAFPLPAAVPLLYGASWRRAGWFAAIFLALAGAHLAGQHAMFRAMATVYPVALDAGLAGRVGRVLHWAVRTFTDGGAEYSPRVLFADGWAAARRSPALFAGLIALALATPAAVFCAIRRQAPPPPFAARRFWVVAAMGGYLFVAAVALFAVQPDARISNRHLRLPLLGAALLAAALVYGRRFVLANRPPPTGRWFAGAAAVALTLFVWPASVVNLGEAASYAKSWDYQKAVAARVAACTPSPFPPDAWLCAEELLSHFQRARTFADDWSLPSLLQTQYPEQFARWQGRSKVTAYVENAPDEQLPLTLSLRDGETGMTVRDQLEFREDGQAVKTIALPLGAASSCPRETLVLDRRRRNVGVVFGAALALLGSEATIRPDGKMSSLVLYFRQAPYGLPEPKLALQMTWRGSLDDPGTLELRPWSNAEPGQVTGLAFEFPYGRRSADDELSVAVIDEVRGALPPTYPAGQDRPAPGHAAVLTFR